MEPNLTKQEGIYNQGVGRDSVGGKLITINIEGRGRGWILVKDMSQLCIVRISVYGEEAEAGEGGTSAQVPQLAGDGPGVPVAPCWPQKPLSSQHTLLA